MSLSISITLNNGIGAYAMKSQNELTIFCGEIKKDTQAVGWHRKKKGRTREEQGKKGRREEEWERVPHVGAANSWETLASLVHGYHKFLDKVNIYPSFIKHIYAE